MEGFIRDLKYGFWVLIRNPAFTAVALLSLGLGIAANTTIFSVFNIIMLRPFPLKDPERLVLLTENHPEQGRRLPTPSAFSEWKRQSQVLEDMARTGFGGGDPMTLSGAGKAERISVGSVTPNFFSVIGVSPILGRTFLRGGNLSWRSGRRPECDHQSQLLAALFHCRSRCDWADGDHGGKQ